MNIPPYHQLSRMFKTQLGNLKAVFGSNLEILTQDETALDIRYSIPISLPSSSMYGRLSPQIPTSIQLNFRVLLPPQFPFHPPTVFLLQKLDLSKSAMNHPLVDENQVLLDPSLNMEGWQGLNPMTNQSFNFGVVLKQALDKFAAYPQFLQFAGPNVIVPNVLATYNIDKYQQKKKMAASSIINPNPNPNPNFQINPNYPNFPTSIATTKPMPQIPGAEANSNKSPSNPAPQSSPSSKDEISKDNPILKEAMEELKKFQNNADEKVALYENEELLIGFLENLKSMKEKRELARNLGKEINNLGEQNMQLSDECTKKLQILKDKNANLAKLKQELENKKQEREAIFRKLTDKEEIAKKLNASVQEKDNQCEEIVKKHFSQAQQNNNSLDVNNFIEEYKKERIAYHLKKQKYDLLLK